MAVAWQATGTLLGSTGADITPTNPSHLADDILILAAWSRASNTLATPSGWTLIENNNGASGSFYYFWIRATSAATTNPLCDWNTALDNKYAVVHCFRGALKVGNPISAIRTDQSATDPHAVPVISTTYADSLVVVIASVLDNLATGMTTTADVAPTTITQRSYTTVATGNDAGQGIATDIKTTAGAINVSIDFTGGVPGQKGVHCCILVPDPGGATVGPAQWFATGAIEASTGADITPVIPSHQAGDYLLLIAASRATATTCATPAGWMTPLYIYGVSNPLITGGTRFWIFYRVAMSASETDPLLDFNDASADKYGFVSVVRGSSGMERLSAVAVAADPASAVNIDTLSTDALLFEGGVSMDNTATDVLVERDTGTTPVALTTHTYTTTTTGSDAGIWAASGIVTGAARNVPGITETFTGSPAAFGFFYATFGSFPAAAVVNVLLNMAPYSHGRGR